jgi:cytochrome c oxidase cbb3-type subunit 3
MRALRAAPFAIVPLVLAVASAGCWREKRQFRGAPAAAARSAPIRLVPIQPGAPIAETSEAGPYDGNAAAISEGQRLYRWYNCGGCHAPGGGGGMGPALSDDEWIYGSQPQNVHATIVEGRPNGMPSFGGHLPDDQVWKIAAYVRSLSGLESSDATSARSDDMERGSQPQPR